MVCFPRLDMYCSSHTTPLVSIDVGIYGSLNLARIHPWKPVCHEQPAILEAGILQ